MTNNGDGTATIAGTPTSGGIFNEKLTAASTAGRASQNFALVVDQSPTFVGSTTKSAKPGHGFTIKIRTAGYPSATLSGPGLPAWASVTNSGSGKGVLSGAAPAIPGSYPLVVTATSVAGTETQTYTLTVT